jgi:hypothetical protein
MSTLVAFDVIILFETPPIYDRVVNPLYDGSQDGRRVKDVYVEIESNNPNVEVTSPGWSGAKIDLSTYGASMDVEFESRIIAPGQNAWSPLVHPGIYYINQDEYCLYGDRQPKDDYAPEAAPEPRDVMITLTADVSARAREADFERVLRTRDDLTGYGAAQEAPAELNALTGDGPITAGTEITADGRVKLLKESNAYGVEHLLAQGYYVTKWQSFGYPLSRLRVQYDTVWPDEGRFGERALYIQ